MYVRPSIRLSVNIDDTSQLCRTGHVSRSKMRALTLILLSYFPFDAFGCILVSALKLEYPLEYNHDTSQLCSTGHDNVSRTRMTTPACILLSELFPLNGFRCNFCVRPIT